MVALAMEDIRARIETLDDNELRRELKNLGLDIGPITATTKATFIGLLAKKLHRLNGGEVPPDNDQDTDVKAVSNNSINSSAVCRKSNSDQKPSIYYGVWLGDDQQSTESVPTTPLVFDRKSDLEKYLKGHKTARFRTFKSKNDAECYSLSTSQYVVNSSLNGSSLDTEPPQQYHGPSRTIISHLQRAARCGLLEQYSDLVEQNPRCLLTAVETPVILQEGLRYNAMHFGSHYNQPEICQYVIDKCKDLQFWKKLYPNDDSEQLRQNCINIALDRYLNTPDKMLAETPLHFACKFGFTEVVKNLLHEPATLRNCKNKHGKLPFDLICTRYNNEDKQEVKESIENLFTEHYFVPIYREDDNVVPPKLGTPCKSDQINLSFDESLLDKALSPIDPKRVLRAYAGPTSPALAKEFHKLLVTPSSIEKRRAYSDIKCRDSEKGIERVARSLARDMQVPWKEYWKFMDGYADFMTSDGLMKLEKYLKESKAKTSTAKTTELDNVTSKLDTMNLSGTPESNTTPRRGESDMETETDENTDGFLVGKIAGIDLDVMRAIRPEDLDSNKYPLVTEWYNKVSSKANADQSYDRLRKKQLGKRILFK
ncbi:uncharacterized protein TRIADDRAFT_61691 [Trichoplax adhaerens]|uniref:LEM domain-containing protein n=1 Tax=Trichoplax adhaerens TaxID=10228 RepID=B3SBP7_TRIAD|nr:hypothetical protein TRIADDRAFT_61691 [Trichoplax adhaerens]EDV19796.1 hypothetical protein TRIADDRAFT_61691 [Trichoplax adhaerens]|eukprot:XP_002117666.1 hypothetical protein TRIADDRAFT_61691 [Trichoplax adhaerens]